MTIEVHNIKSDGYYVKSCIFLPQHGNVHSPLNVDLLETTFATMATLERINGDHYLNSFRLRRKGSFILLMKPLTKYI